MQDQNDPNRGHSNDQDLAISIINSIINSSNETLTFMIPSSYFQDLNLNNPTKRCNYEEYVINFLTAEEMLKLQDFIDRTFYPSRYLYEEKSPIFGQTFRLNLYWMNSFRSYSLIFSKPHLREKYRLYVHSHLVMEPEDLLLTY